MISKRIVFWVSLTLSAVFIFMFFMNTGTNYCYSHGWCMWFRDFRSSFGIYFVIFPLVFLFSLVTYKMRDEVFKSWSTFSAFCVSIFILMMILLQIIPDDGGGALLGGGFVKVAFLLLFLFAYFLISLIIIISKHISLKKSAAQK